MNRRRDVLAVLGACAAMLPLRPFAQGKVWRVGFLTLQRVAILESDYNYGPFRQAMR